MLDDIGRNQSGIVTRDQALANGLTRDAILARTRSGRWQHVHRNTYATFSGELPRNARLWAAVLAAGPSATLSHHTAAEVACLTDERRHEVHLTIPAARRIAMIEGTVIHRSRRIDTARHPVRRPPQTRIEETALDLAGDASSVDQAIAWLAAACGRRLTTSSKLLAVLDERHRFPWRPEIRAALGDIAAGCHSILERNYLHDVERAHALPTGVRQAPAEHLGGRIYQDVRYSAFGTVVELDGVIAHPIARLARDLDRDNVAGLMGESVLHYGWADITTRPCRVAQQVAGRLSIGGWQSRPKPCRGRNCVIVEC